MSKGSRGKYQQANEAGHQKGRDAVISPSCLRSLSPLPFDSIWLGNTSLRNRTGEGHKPLPLPLTQLKREIWRLAFALAPDQGFLYGYGAIGGGGHSF